MLRRLDDPRYEEDESMFRWMRVQPEYVAKEDKEEYFFDKVSNRDIAVALFPIFLVLVLILNIIA